jgi:hypothetical protein
MKGFKSDNARMLFEGDRITRHFFKFFKSKKTKVRTGALDPNELKKLVNQIGKHKKANIRRVEYDGTPEETPVSIDIVDIREEYFTGKIINVERSIMQDMDEKTVYVKGGGGTIDFYFNDGDILSIEEDIDETVIKQMNADELLEILDALDLNESILIGYYDRAKGGVINGVGKLIEKDVVAKTFKVELNLINDIELDDPKIVALDLEKDSVLDLSVMI